MRSGTLDFNIGLNDEIVRPLAFSTEVVRYLPTYLSSPIVSDDGQELYAGDDWLGERGEGHAGSVCTPATQG